MYMAKNKLDRKMVNVTQSVEALHQLASSYFIDRDGTMKKLHEIQISTNAIKVGTPQPVLTPSLPMCHSKFPPVISAVVVGDRPVKQSRQPRLRVPATEA